MRKRLLSMLLAFAMVLGILPMLSMEAAADEPASVTVYLSMSEDDEFMTGAETTKPIVMMPVTVPYFDLALYGLEEYYFSSEEYGSDGGDHSSDLEPGTAEFAKDKVTLLHLYIYVTELFYCGEDEGGKGYLYDEGMMGTDVLNFSGGVGSSFITQMWGEDCNLQYYVNYVYPLASSGWGATSDQILLEDGDIVTLGHFTSWDFYADSTAIFNYITAEKNTVTQGEQLALSVLRAGKDPDAVGENYDTVSIPVTSCPTLYYAPVDDIPSGDVTDWEKLDDADEEGNYMLDTTGWEPGTYMIAIPGQYGAEFPDAIVSTPGGMLLTVLADEPEAPPVNYGDVNGDSSVDASDVSLVAQYVANLYKDIDTAAADVDNSGSIDASDVSLIAQYVAHLLDALPVGSANS